MVSLKKSILRYTRGITQKRVTSGMAQGRSLLINRLSRMHAGASEKQRAQGLTGIRKQLFVLEMDHGDLYSLRDESDL